MLTWLSTASVGFQIMHGCHYFINFLLEKIKYAVSIRIGHFRLDLSTSVILLLTGPSSAFEKWYGHGTS